MFLFFVFVLFFSSSIITNNRLADKKPLTHSRGMYKLPKNEDLEEPGSAILQGADTVL